MSGMRLVLASASPRRKRLLLKITKKFSVEPANASERIGGQEGFPAAAKRLALKKALEVAKRNPGAVVVGADTVAYLGRRNFRKTEKLARARETLAFLSGKAHYVVTGVAVVFPGRKKPANYCVKAVVRMKKIEGRALCAYLKSGEWKGRAGCYDVSGKGRALVASVRGEKETVVGLPLAKLRRLLSKLQ
jgi:septum formation protein